MAGRCIQDVGDGASVQYVLVRDNICGSRTMDAKDAGGPVGHRKRAGVLEEFGSSEGF